MKINQISLFLENKPGHLNAVCRTLAEAQIKHVTSRWLAPSSSASCA